jgi:hypothetical protein
MNNLRRIFAAVATLAAAVLALTVTPAALATQVPRPVKAAASHPHLRPWA